MSASEFIILRIHPTHPKVMRLAELTGDNPYEACGRAVAWFRYIDQHFGDSHTCLTREMFNRTIDAPKARRGKLDYFTAMQDELINWISVDPNGTVVIVEYESNFSRSSRRRAQDAKYQASKRRHSVSNRSADRREESDESSPTHRRNDELQTQPQTQTHMSLSVRAGEAGPSDVDWHRVQAAFQGRMGYAPSTSDLTALYRVLQGLCESPIVMAGTPRDPTESLLACIRACPVEKTNPVSYIRGIVDNSRTRGALPDEDRHERNGTGSAAIGRAARKSRRADGTNESEIAEPEVRARKL